MVSSSNVSLKFAECVGLKATNIANALLVEVRNMNVLVIFYGSMIGGDKVTELTSEYVCIMGCKVV